MKTDIEKRIPAHTATTNHTLNKTCDNCCKSGCVHSVHVNACSCWQPIPLKQQKSAISTAAAEKICFFAFLGLAIVVILCLILY